MKDRFIQLQQGRVHYLDGGQGAPLILLHSNGCSAHEYDSVAPELAKRYRVLSLDMPGHGDSVRITSHHDIGAYADIVVEFMDALAIDKAWVLGSSIGGFICADLGIRHADRMLGVLMVEAALRPAAEWEAQWTVVEQLFGEAVQTLDQVAPRFRAFTKEHLFRWNVDRAKAGVWVMMDVMWAIRQYDLVAALPKIESPVALIFGDRGPVTAGIPGYVTALPDAPRHILDNCGHFPMIDDPEAFLKATFASLDRLAAAKR